MDKDLTVKDRIEFATALDSIKNDLERGKITPSRAVLNIQGLTNDPRMERQTAVDFDRELTAFGIHGGCNLANYVLKYKHFLLSLKDMNLTTVKEWERETLKPVNGSLDIYKYYISTTFGKITPLRIKDVKNLIDVIITCDLMLKRV